jgi:hypothetical protein
MTKHEIKTEARRHGYDATYSGRTGQWTLKRIKPSTNTRAFESVVFANLARKLGIEDRMVK